MLMFSIALRQPILPTTHLVPVAISHSPSQPIAKLLFALSLAPQYHKHQIPPTPPANRPPNSEIPLPIPKLTYNGYAQMMHPAAIIARHRSLAANRLAAYCGYVSGRYMKMHWNNTNAPIANNVMPIAQLALTSTSRIANSWREHVNIPMTLTIQCVPFSAVHPNQNIPA